MNKILDNYTVTVNNILVDITIQSLDEEPVPLYILSITNISETTKIILEKIREEFINNMNFQEIEKAEEERGSVVLRERFQSEIKKLLEKYFPTADESTKEMLINYLVEENLGLGKIEILLKDPNLEEICINNSKEPVWAYHRKYGWTKTNINLISEARIRHFSMTIGREVGKEITSLSPLMDAHLSTGDRVNATLMPISTKGNTITIRKFADDPWTITKFIKQKTISFAAAALIWLAIENELSILIAGGTGSGKTSMLNVISNFFPANQRIISIEDTRELTLPDILHWVPMETRLPNPEGKGEVTMLDLLVNSLRMRPDRIIFGEIRRKREAEVLLEAIHTGHSVYGTIHANSAEEVIMRLTNPPIDIPKPMVSSLGLIVVQNRNRRTGYRRTLQIAEILSTGDENVLLQLDPYNDRLVKVKDSETVMERLRLYTGMTPQQLSEDLEKRIRILKWMVVSGKEDVNTIGVIMSKYYRGLLTEEEMQRSGM